MERFNSRFPMLLFAAWAILYLPRSFALGLYGDDWWSLIEPQHATAPFSFDRLHYFVGFMANYGPRPLLGCIAFVATSIAGSSPAALQFLSSLLVLAAALSLRAWLNRLMNVFPEYRAVAADFAAIFWMSLPWMVGTTAWPMVAHNVASQIMFTETARLLLAQERMSLTVPALVIGGVTASGLIYEAFYLAIFPIVLLYAICGRGPAKNRRQAAILLGICMVAQALPVAFNRYASQFNPAIRKAYNSRWPQFWIGNMLSLPRTLLGTLNQYRVAAIVLLVAALVCASLLWIRDWRVREDRRLPVLLLGLAVAAATALLLTVAVYSAVGYGFQPVGVDSRTLMAPSLWLSLAFFALLCCLFLQGAGKVKAVLLMSAVGLIPILAVAQKDRVAEWAGAWSEEQRILESAPVAKIHGLPRDAALFFIGPAVFHGVTVFGAQWDLTAAVRWHGLPQGTRPYQNLIMIYPAGETGWTWDGTTLAQTWQRGGKKYAVPRLYIWRDGNADLQPVQPGFRWTPRDLR